MVAHRRINNNREDGRSVSEKLAAIKKMTVASVFKEMTVSEVFMCGTTRLGIGILANVKDNFNTHQVKEA